MARCQFTQSRFSIHRAIGEPSVSPARPAGAAPTLLATASTEHVWVDASTRRPVRFPEELKAPFERFLPVRGTVAAVD